VKAGGLEISHPRTGQTSQYAEVGESDTQNLSEYAFQYENSSIKLIDTPGLNDIKDTSDHTVDKEHIRNILRLLSAYDEIHAICIVLKASENRLSTAFKYVLTEILKCLDKSACNNVIFICTHAASENFKPDKTQRILLKFFLQKRSSHLSTT